MAHVATNLTGYPNGVAQFIGIGAGAAAGAVTIAGGIEVGDRILQVFLLVTSNALVKTLTDLTSQFVSVGALCTTADQISNTGGTSTAAGVVICTFAKAAGNVT